MSINPISLTKAKIDTNTDEDVERYLRIKYVGTRSESLSDIHKFELLDKKPRRPIVTLDRTRITPGTGIAATGSDFFSRVPGNMHLSTEWRVSKDLEGTNVTNITGIQNSLTSATIDDFFGQPSGNFYISARYEGKLGFSKWSEPTMIDWATYDIPDEYWEKQEIAFDTIKAVAEECRDADMFVSSMLTSMRNLRWRATFYDSPVGDNVLQLGLNAENGVVTGNVSYIEATGQVYGDTFIATITDPKLFAGHKKGHFRYSSNYPIQIFDLEKSHGKLVLSYETGSYKLWFAYLGDSFDTGGTFYVIPKESPLRDEVAVDLMTLPYWDPIQ